MFDEKNEGQKSSDTITGLIDHFLPMCYLYIHKSQVIGSTSHLYLCPAVWHATHVCAAAF